MGDVSLKVAFPNIFRLALDSSALVANCFDSNSRVWDPSLRRSPNDWELAKLLGMLELLGNSSPRLNSRDEWIWGLNSKGCFMVKSLYARLFSTTNLLVPHKSIWMVEIQSQMSFFIWTCFLDKILTLNHLQNRGWILANRCVLCMVEVEYIHHILMHCFMAKMVWAFFLCHI